MSAPIDDRRCNDVGVNCCQEIGNEQSLEGTEELIENIIEDETMETTTVERATHERERSALTYNDYLQMIETEEERIEEIENEIEVKTLELSDVENSIELEEAERLNNLKVLYEETVARRKQGQERLEKLEAKLEDRRNYLYSFYSSEGGGLREATPSSQMKANYVDKEYESRKDILDGNIENNSTYTSNNITKTYF